jgi:hypothetical protein
MTKREREVQKMARDMAAFLRDRMEDFREKYLGETALLASDDAGNLLAAMLGKLLDKDSWSDEDHIKISALSFLLAIGLAENEEDEDDQKEATGT